MRITDLQLEQYGIYHNESWSPAASRLNVVMGENESGKTTLLRFIRDMMFGFERGKWQGKKGNMAFVRADGTEYRVFRHDKAKWFVDGHGDRYEEELSALWWHGLNRALYEKIFAVGLEDLQGTSFLSDDSVRSHFFMLQGGDRISRARNAVADDMGNLLVSSSQGKRKINQILASLAAVQSELDDLSGQEKDFAVLQKKRETLKKELEILISRLAHDREADKLLEKRLGAWEYYKRASEIKRQLLLSEQVKLFPTNGKEQWNHLVNRMKVIKEQKDSLQGKLSEYQPKTKEEIIPWANMSSELEKLYIDLGQWKQTLADEDELKRTKSAWENEFIHLGYALPLWDKALNPKEACRPVDWSRGRELAQSVNVRNNELHFWQQREPEVELVDGEASEPAAAFTEEEWKVYESDAAKLEQLIHDEAALTEEQAALNAEEDRNYTFWFWAGAFLLVAAIAAVVMFYMSAVGYTVLYGAAAASAVSLICFLVNNHISHTKGSRLEKLGSEISALNGEKEEIIQRFPENAPRKEEDLPAFHNMMQAKRGNFYKLQARQQALSWKRETVKKQQAAHKTWAEEGKSLKESQASVMKAWHEWLEQNKLPKADPDKLSELQEQWQKIYSEEGKGRIFDVRIETVREKLKAFGKRAESIIRATGLSYPLVPDSIAEIYEENRARNLEWQSVIEKNHQHAAYQQEMSKLNLEWASCQREMDALFNLVNARNAEDFAEKVNAHENHDRLVKDWENVRHDIRLYAGSDDDFSRLWAALESGKYEEWMAEHHQLLEKIENESKQMGEMQRQQGAVENEVFRLAGDDTITKKLQKKKEIETELARLMEDWLACLFTETVLEKTQERYDSGKQPKIIEMASRFLGEMTKGKYSLVAASDGKDIQIVDEAHNVKDSKAWSSGTGDQVYLAIRLAMALSFGKQMEALPIVLDDIFVRFDEGRQRETLRFLMELGQKQQIFLFTCHERTMKIAEEVGREKNTGEFIRLQAGKISVNNNM